MKTIAGRPLRELHHSANSNMYFANIKPGHWQHVDATDAPATVGPIYPTRGELLADSNRYCGEYGCMGAK
jgi:hypothetical protein